MIIVNTARNDQTYVNSHVAHHITCHISIRNELFRSRHTIPGSHTRKLGAPLFFKEVGNSTLALHQPLQHRHKHITESCLH